MVLIPQATILERVYLFLGNMIEIEYSQARPAYQAILSGTDFLDDREIDSLIIDFATAIQSHGRTLDFEVFHSPHQENLHRETVAALKAKLLSIRSMTWGECLSSFDKDFMDKLSLMAAYMAANHRQQGLPPEDLGRISAEIGDFYEQVSESNLEKTMKDMLLLGLQSMKYAIMTYRVYGINGIRSAIDQNVALWQRYGAQMKEDDRNDPMVRALFEWFLVLDKTISSLTNVLPLAVPAVQHMLVQ